MTTFTLDTKHRGIIIDALRGEWLEMRGHLIAGRGDKKKIKSAEQRAYKALVAIENTKLYKSCDAYKEREGKEKAQ